MRSTYKNVTKKQLSNIRRDLRFVGRNLKLHVVGPYAIAEYETEHPRSVISVDRWRKNFQAYVDGVDTSATWSSLDLALAHAIAFRHDGPNTRAGIYFVKGVQNEKTR